MRISSAAVMAFLAAACSQEQSSGGPLFTQSQAFVLSGSPVKNRRRRRVHTFGNMAGGDQDVFNGKEAAARQQRLEQDIQQATIDSQQLQERILMAEQERQLLQQRAEEASLELQQLETTAAKATSNTIFTVASLTTTIGGIAAARQALSQREAKLEDDLKQIQQKAKEQEQKLKAQKQQGNALLVSGKH
jgi:chromosome segregation ATPase